MLCILADNKSRFILAVVVGEFALTNTGKPELMATLQADGYDHIRGGYGYLLRMPLWNLTREKVAILCAERDTKHAEHSQLQRESAEQHWCHDLERLRKGISSM